MREPLQLREAPPPSKLVTDEAFELQYGPNEVGGDLVVECWISHSPRAAPEPQTQASTRNPPT